MQEFHLQSHTSALTEFSSQPQQQSAMGEVDERSDIPVNTEFNVPLNQQKKIIKTKKDQEQFDQRINVDHPASTHNIHLKSITIKTSLRQYRSMRFCSAITSGRQKQQQLFSYNNPYKKNRNASHRYLQDPFSYDTRQYDEQALVKRISSSVIKQCTKGKRLASHLLKHSDRYYYGNLAQQQQISNKPKKIPLLQQYETMQIAQKTVIALGHNHHSRSKASSKENKQNTQNIGNKIGNLTIQLRKRPHLKEIYITSKAKASMESELRNSSKTFALFKHDSNKSSTLDLFTPTLKQHRRNKIQITLLHQPIFQRDQSISKNCF